MTGKIMSKLSSNRQAILLGYMHKFHNGRNKKHTLPDEYLDKIFSTNKLICYHCMQVINIGEKYENNKNSGGLAQRKYYHKSCYNRMFY